jgi:argininosuccinate synthase
VNALEREALQALVTETQRNVTGVVRLKLTLRLKFARHVKVKG